MAKIIKQPYECREYQYDCECGAIIQFGPEDVEKEKIPESECYEEHDWEFVQCPICFKQHGWSSVQRDGQEVE